MAFLIYNYFNIHHPPFKAITSITTGHVYKDFFLYLLATTSQLKLIGGKDANLTKYIYKKNHMTI